MSGFPSGARVVFLGDSIVARNRTMAAVAYYYHEKYPERRVQFFNCGVSGGSADTVQLYLDTDTLPLRPTHAVLATAINDSRRNLLAQPQSAARYDALAEAFAHYKRSMRALCARLRENGIEVTLCTPPPYAEYQAGDAAVLRGAYALTAGYAQFCRELAAELDAPLCDYHAYMTEQMQRETLYDADRVHPNARGLWHMANALLESQGEGAVAAETLPPEWEAWHTAVSCRRTIYSTEWNVIRSFAQPTEEKMAFVQRYLDEKQYATDYFHNIAVHYLKHKPHEAEELAALLIQTKSLMG